ncbi:protein O-mannosyl-transferase family [Tateyamaria sp. SN3-11]|uniref:protein O-mannosyl-transferase family n=1 Tax=Tateyamaria sp. SN3-11 TaxID=3092147 RepID=UPI0039E86178
MSADTAGVPHPGQMLAPQSLRTPWRSPLIAASVLFIWLVYYGFCIFPGLGGVLNAGDSAKFQTLGHTSILVHGPGYPLILMLGAVVRSLSLPFEPWWVMTFVMASVPGAVANMMAFLIVGRLTRSAVFGLAAAMLLGSAGLMAVQSTEAEVYPLALAFILSTGFLLLRFVETKQVGYFIAACGVYALSFGNHLMMIMLVPVFLWVTAAHFRILLRPKIIGAVLLLIAAGASQYLYLAWVTHAPGTAYSEYLPLPPTTTQLLQYIAGTYFGDLYGSGLASTQTTEVLLNTLSFAHPRLSAPIIVLGLLAMAAGWWQRQQGWKCVALILGIGLAFMPFTLWYGAYDIRAFHLPVLGPLLIGSIAAIGWALGRWPRARLGIGVVILAFGVLRSGEMAGYLSARTPLFDGLVETLEEVVAQSPVQDPVVSMTYDVRMATLYHELQNGVPKPASYRVTWRTQDEIAKRDPVGGIVLPTDGGQFLKWVEHRHPDLACETRTVEQTVATRWPAYAFLCEARALPASPAPPATQD